MLPTLPRVLIVQNMKFFLFSLVSEGKDKRISFRYEIPLYCSVCMYVCVCVLVAQSCPTFCSPMDTSGFSVHGILQERILEWVAIPFSRESS